MTSQADLSSLVFALNGMVRECAQHAQRADSGQNRHVGKQYRQQLEFVLSKLVPCMPGGRHFVARYYTYTTNLGTVAISIGDKTIEASDITSLWVDDQVVANILWDVSYLIEVLK